jgi:orotidine-5'-phosphate decarboxylase
MTPFGARFVEAVAARGPLCVGIDPHPALLADWGLPATVEGLKRFSLDAADAIGDLAAVVKPQSAFFESYGSAGIAVLETVIGRLRAAGALVLLDVKRGDIGSTMTAYAAAYLQDGSPLAVDAVTVSPYLGFGTLQPAIDAARQSDRGVFVLCRTSNPDSAQVQRAIDADGRSVAQAVVDQVAALNADVSPLGAFGLVVGATVGELDVDIAALNGPILAPGLGSQGGGPDDLAFTFGDQLAAVLPSSSRQMLAAGPARSSLRQAVRQQNDQLRH